MQLVHPNPVPKCQDAAAGGAPDPLVAPLAPPRRGGDAAEDVDFAADADFETSKGVKPITTFEAMRLKEDLLKGVYAYGFEKPSAIQQRAVAPFVQGRDVIAQAQSGTGKSSMIAISLCQMCDTKQNAYVDGSLMPAAAWRACSG